MLCNCQGVFRIKSNTSWAIIGKFNFFRETSFKKGWNERYVYVHVYFRDFARFRNRERSNAKINIKYRCRSGLSAWLACMLEMSLFRLHRPNKLSQIHGNMLRWKLLVCKSACWYFWLYLKKRTRQKTGKITRRYGLKRLNRRS